MRTTRVIVFIAGIAGLAAQVCAAPAPPAPPAHSSLGDLVANLDNDIAALLQRRDNAADNGPLLELQIDLRIIARSFLARSADAGADSDLQVCAYLRGMEMLSTADQAGQKLQTSTKAITPLQISSLAKVHQLSYKVSDAKNGAQMDGFCRDIGIAMITGAGPFPPELRSLPLMRPQPIEDAGPARSSPRTLASLAALAQQAAVTPALHRQLEALVNAATAAVADSAHQDEASNVYEMLSEAADLADGLQHNTGVSPEDRVKTEAQLASALALYTDVRTRSIGRSRVQTLSHYRQTLMRIQRLKLPAALQEKLAPAFIWAQENGDNGAKVLDAIESYVQLCAALDADKAPPNLPPSEKKLVDDMRRQFDARRQSFLDDSANLSGSGVLSVGPEQLKSHVDVMKDSLDAIQSAEQLPHVLQVLLPYHPKPFGGLEKRTSLAVSALASPAPGVSRDEAAKFLQDLRRLAVFADELAKGDADIPPDVVKVWTNGRLSAFDAKRNALVNDLVTLAASNHDIDQTTLTLLDAAHAMVASLRADAAAQVATSRADVMNRWVDWAIDPAQLQAMLGPYRESTVSAFDRFASDDASAPADWARSHKQYAPFVALLAEAGRYVDQCADFPSGLAALIAQLVTPLDGQPFATERFASFKVASWARNQQAVDLHGQDVDLEDLGRRLRRDLHLEE